MRKGYKFNNQATAHIYHNGNCHFVSAVQTCAEYIEFSDSHYDKKPAPPSPTVLEQMKLNFKTRDKRGKLPIRSHCVQKQSAGNLDCGLFAAVNIWILLSHLDPSKYGLDEETLRPSILESFCLNKWKVPVFNLKKARGSYCVYKL